MTKNAVAELVDEQQRLLVEIAAEHGEPLFTTVLPVRRLAREEGQPATAGPATTEVLRLADIELSVAGWVQVSKWQATHQGDDRWQTTVTPRPRLPVVEVDRRALEAMHRLTTMARSPVTAAALVPLVAPRWQTAAAVVTRLTTAGQVRAVGRTTDPRPRLLYAPVGSPWAPE